MSIETAMAALNTPTPSATPPPQSQALTKQEVTAAVSESETKANNGEQSTAADSNKTETGAEAKVEAPVTETKTEPKKEEPLSAKFSALAKKEKAIVEQSKSIKASEAKLAEREAAIAAREAKIAKSESLWETDVFAAIKERTGMDYNALTLAQLDGKYSMPEETDPIKVAKKTIEDFKKEMAQKEEEQKTATQKAKEAADAKQKSDLEAAWEAYNTEVQEFVSANKDEYELISTYNQQSLIAETVDEFYKQNKRVLSVKEAADLVEKYLEDEAKKALGTKKFSKQPEKPAADAKSVGEPKITRTLNNSMQPTAASVLPAVSEADRMKRALAAMESKR